MSDGDFTGGYAGRGPTTRIGFAIYFATSLIGGVAVVAAGLPITVALILFACAAVFAVVYAIQSRRGEFK